MISTFQVGNSQTQTTFFYIHHRTHQEEFLFGDGSSERTILNPSGQIAADEWQQIAAAHQRNITLDLWTILPNGIRALIAVVNVDLYQPSTYGLRQSAPKPRALSSFVAGFKAAAAKRINLVRGNSGTPVWQRGYQEQRIDDPQTLERIRQLLANQTHSAADKQLVE